MADAKAPVADPVTVETTDTAVIARLNVKFLDDQCLKRMDELVDKAACGRPGVNVIVLDMSHVQIVPSLGLGAILQLSKKFGERKQHVKLAAVQPQVKTTMAITKLDRILDLEDTVEAAIMSA
jgi:anti-anti-sigma factor